MPGLTYLNSRARKGTVISIKLNEKSYQRAVARLKKYEGRPLTERMKRVYRAGLGVAAPPMRRATPRASGDLAKSVSIRSRRPSSPRKFANIGLKPRKPHSHLVVLGTRAHPLAVKRAGKRAFSKFPDGEIRENAMLWHPGSKPRPFIAYIIRFYEPKIKRFIQDNVVDEGAVSAFASSARGF
jgi:hypothetical protein